MKNLEEFFGETNSISKKDYIKYAVGVLKSNEHLDFVLAVIISNKTTYRKEICDVKFKGAYLNTHIIKRSIESLNYLGLIKRRKNLEFGVAKIYSPTRMGVECAKITAASS